MAPKGRDEEGLAHTMAWVRHHDKYSEGYFVDPTQTYVEPAKVSRLVLFRRAPQLTVCAATGRQRFFIS